MALDGLFLNRILTEIQADLIDAKINRVHQPQDTTVTLKLKSHRRGNCLLLLTAHPQNARVHFTETSYDNPKTPPLFAMVLRKHIEGGRIIDVSQIGLDRVADITIEARNEIGDIEEKHVIIEIMGKHSNIILCDSNRVILAAVKQYGSAVSRYRQVLPHEPYILPPPSHKLNPFLMTEEEFETALLAKELHLPLAKAVLQTVEGVSPQTAAELVYASNLPTSFPLEQAGSYELRCVFQQIQQLLRAETLPTIVYNEEKTLDFYYLPLRHHQGLSRSAVDLSALLDDYFGAKERENAFQTRKAALKKIIGQHRAKTAAKVEKQKEELCHAVDGEKYRLYGELLSANLYQVPNYIEEVVLENFYDDNRGIKVPLLKELTAADNASRYFKRYHKAKTARNAIREHLTENENELAYLESLYYQCENAQNDDDLAETRSEVIHSGYLKAKKQTKGEKRDAPLPPLETVYMDYTILIGRNNKQNDRLTLKAAQKDDLWLHTKNIPGSHVIIRKKDGEEIPEAVITRAAQYAAFHSKAKESPKVPVDYTEVKQVKKPNGARPGMVIYFEQTTIMVEPKQPVIDTAKPNQ
ncbi:MAG TPA: NFACT RNA binding domain-containing protein [Clostridiales bacterium]|nr:NFACT RNA binding domain-containing protein [Clostridiales bacterium]